MLDTALLRRLLTVEWDVRWFESVTSTNDVARRAAEEGERGPLVIGAETQTAGRGRRGRRWLDVPGRSLLFTVVLSPPDPRQGSLLGLCAAASVLLALEELGASGLAIRWPNDVAWGGRKVCGILVEAAGDAFLAGIGVNVLGSARDLGCDRPAATVEEILARPLSREEVLARILNHFHALYHNAVLGDSHYLHTLVSRRDALKGRRVVVILPNKRVVGTAAGIDAHGRLGVQMADTGSVVWLTAGEVVAVE